MKKNKVRLVIFDLDGTLIDSTEEIQFVVNSALEKNNFPIRSKEFYIANIGSGIEDLLVKSLPNTFTQNFNEVLNQVKNIYSENLNKKSKVFDGVYDILNLLLTRNTHIGLVTNKLHLLALKCVEKYFKKYKMKSYGAGYLYERKPNPKSTLEIMSFYQVKPQNTLFIGDSEIDIKTAKNANIISGGVLWGNGSAKELENASADLLFKTPKDLFKYLNKSLF